MRYANPAEAAAQRAFLFSNRFSAYPKPPVLVRSPEVVVRSGGRDFAPEWLPGFLLGLDYRRREARVKLIAGAVPRLEALEDGSYDPVGASICHWCPDETCERRQG